MATAANQERLQETLDGLKKTRMEVVALDGTNESRGYRFGAQDHLFHDWGSTDRERIERMFKAVREERRWRKRWSEFGLPQVAQFVADYARGYTDHGNQVPDALKSAQDVG